MVWYIRPLSQRISSYLQANSCISLYLTLYCESTHWGHKGLHSLWCWWDIYPKKTSAPIFWSPPLTKKLLYRITFPASPLKNTISNVMENISLKKIKRIKYVPKISQQDAFKDQILFRTPVLLQSEQPHFATNCLGKCVCQHFLVYGLLFHLCLFVYEDPVYLLHSSSYVPAFFVTLCSLHLTMYSTCEKQVEDK